MSRFTKNKHRRDANHSQIVEFLRKAGAVVDDVSQQSALGYDLVVNYQGVVVLVEVKNGEAKPSDRRLSESEKEAALRHGDKFAVVTSTEEARALLVSMAEHRKRNGSP